MQLALIASATYPATRCSTPISRLVSPTVIRDEPRDRSGSGSMSITDALEDLSRRTSSTFRSVGC